MRNASSFNLYIAKNLNHMTHTADFLSGVIKPPLLFDSIRKPLNSEN